MNLKVLLSKCDFWKVMAFQGMRRTAHVNLAPGSSPSVLAVGTWKGPSVEERLSRGLDDAAGLSTL